MIATRKNEFYFDQHRKSAEVLGIVCPSCKGARNIYFEAVAGECPCCMISCDSCHLTFFVTGLTLFCGACNFRLFCLLNGGEVSRYFMWR